MQHDQRLSRELLALEKKYWDAIKDQDSTTAASLSGDPCIVVGPQGAGELDRSTLEKMMKNANYQLENFELDNVHARRITDDVAVLTYKVTEDLVVEGQNLSLDAYDSSIWVRSDGEWVCVVHTESIAGDPFGRDREH